MLLKFLVAPVFRNKIKLIQLEACHITLVRVWKSYHQKSFPKKKHCVGQGKLFYFTLRKISVAVFSPDDQLYMDRNVIQQNEAAHHYLLRKKNIQEEI